MEKQMKAPTEQKPLPLQLPTPEIADRGNLRFGAGVITSDFPVLRRPDPEIADRGVVRFGAGVITSDFPVRR
jgi:hypothetical protein